MTNSTLADLVRERQDKASKAQQAIALVRLVRNDPELCAIVLQELSSPQPLVDLSVPTHTDSPDIQAGTGVRTPRAEQVMSFFREHGNKWMKIRDVAHSLDCDRRIVAYIVYMSRKDKFEKRSLSGTRKGVEFRLKDEP